MESNEEHKVVREKGVGSGVYGARERGGEWEKGRLWKMGLGSIYIPAAFLEMIELVTNGKQATVDVTSRALYIILSAGTSDSV